MWKKLASLIAGSVLVSSCQTPMYKPIICQPGTALKDGRCQKVPRIVKKPTPVRPKTTQPQKLFDAPSWTQPRQNVYGQPL